MANNLVEPYLKHFSYWIYANKAEFAIDLFFLMKKLEIEKTKPSFIISVLKVEC